MASEEAGYSGEVVIDVEGLAVDEVIDSSGASITSHIFIGLTLKQLATDATAVVAFSSSAAGHIFRECIFSGGRRSLVYNGATFDRREVLSPLGPVTRPC